MRGFARQLIWLIRKDGFKTQVLDEGRPDILIPEIEPTPATFLGDGRATFPTIKTTRFIRKQMAAPPDLMCAHCGCNPSGFYYEEQ